MPKQTHVLYSVAGVPFQGMVSAMDSAMLPEGTWSYVQNARWSDGTIKVRPAIDEYRATGVSGTSGIQSGTVVGQLNDGGTNQYVAVNVSNAIRVYKWVTSAWVEVNASNRLGNVTRVWFEKFTLQAPGTTKSLTNTLSTYSYTVVQDGSSAPLMIQNGIGTATGMAAPVAAIAAPNISRCEAIPFSLAYLTVSSAAFTNSNTSTTMATGTASAGTIVNLKLNVGGTSTTTAGHSITVGFSNTFTSGTVSQFQIIHNQNESDIWENFCIEVINNSVAYVIHQPGVTSYQTSVVGDRYQSSMFDCTSVATNGTSSTISDFISFPSFTSNRLRFTYVGNNPGYTIEKVIPIYAMAFGGNIPFGSEFGVTYYDPATAVESAPAICKNVLPPALKRVGGTPLPGVTLAPSPLAKYSYRIQYQETGTYAVNVYSRLGKTYQILDFATAFCTATGEMGASTLHTLSYGRWQMPSNLATQMPIGAAMAVSGDRLYVAKNNGAGSALQRSSVAFSEKRFPNRFYVNAEIIDGQVQPRSGGEALFGDETVYALITQAGGIYAGEAVFAFTDKAAYQMNGVDAIQLSRPTNIGPYGCVSPGSVVRYRNTVVWVTPGRQIMTLGGDLGNLSSRMIEDVLYGVPASRIPFIESEVYRDRLYVGYTPTGGTKNTNALVYDARTENWGIDVISTLSNASYAKWCKAVLSNEERLLCFDTTGWLFDTHSTVTTGDRYVTATTTTQPRIQLTSRTLSNTFLEQFRLGDIMIVADSQGTGVVWDASLIDRRTGLTTAGKINMYDSNAYKVWKYGRGTTEDLRIGLASLGVQVDIQGAGVPNSAIYAISVDEEEQTPHGATRD